MPYVQGGTFTTKSVPHPAFTPLPPMRGVPSRRPLPPRRWKSLRRTSRWRTRPSKPQTRAKRARWRTRPEPQSPRCPWFLLESHSTVNILTPTPAGPSLPWWHVPSPGRRSPRRSQRPNPFTTRPRSSSRKVHGTRRESENGRRWQMMHGGRARRRMSDAYSASSSRNTLNSRVDTRSANTKEGSSSRVTRSATRTRTTRFSPTFPRTRRLWRHPRTSMLMGYSLAMPYRRRTGSKPISKHRSVGSAAG